MPGLSTPMFHIGIRNYYSKFNKNYYHSYSKHHYHKFCFNPSDSSCSMLHLTSIVQALSDTLNSLAMTKPWLFVLGCSHPWDWSLVFCGQNKESLQHSGLATWKLLYFSWESSKEGECCKCVKSAMFTPVFYTLVSCPLVCTLPPSWHGKQMRAGPSLSW